MGPSGIKVVEVVVAGGLGVLGALAVVSVSIQRRALVVVRPPVQAAARRLRRQG